MKKMALFGGSFDPIHSSHVAMALRLADKLGLDEVVLMPTFVPPHKIKETMAPAEDRLAMCRLAAEADSRLSVSRLELNREGASFTVDTLVQLCKQHPDTQWYLITGADMFCTLRTWHRFSEIANMAVLCTVPRGEIDASKLREYAAGLEQMGARCYVDEEPVGPISSTELRCRVAAGQPLTGLVPPKVEAYIRQRGLYQTADAMSNRTRDEQFREIIRVRLGDYRYHHSLCVAEESARLAEKYGADAATLYTAGLLHDILKDTAPNAQLQILADFGILLDDVAKQVSKLWHAVSGAAFIEHILGVKDRVILDAVRYHTTGRAGMSLEEKILFVADFTSADRNYPDVVQMRRLAEESLESAMVYGIDFTIRDLLNQGQPVHPDTLAAYNEIVLNRGEPRAKGGLLHE